MDAALGDESTRVTVFGEVSMFSRDTLLHVADRTSLLMHWHSFGVGTTDLRRTVLTCSNSSSVAMLHSSTIVNTVAMLSSQKEVRPASLNTGRSFITPSKEFRIEAVEMADDLVWNSLVSCSAISS